MQGIVETISQSPLIGMIASQSEARIFDKRAICNTYDVFHCMLECNLQTRSIRGCQKTGAFFGTRARVNRPDGMYDMVSIQGATGVNASYVARNTGKQMLYIRGKIIPCGDLCITCITPVEGLAYS